MGTPGATPQQIDVSKEIFDLASTLTGEAQAAALRKAEELKFDLNRGRIPLQETLINMGYIRDILLDLVEGAKLPQVPLKIQTTLLSQLQRVAQQLNSMIAGTDAVQALEESVEELTVSIWQYGLHNLSGEVLGYTRKMNQLKSQEVTLREATREASLFRSVRDESEQNAKQIVDMVEFSKRTVGELSEIVGRSVASSEAVSKNEETVKAKTAEIMQVLAAATTNLKIVEEGSARAAQLTVEAEQSKARAAEAESSIAGILKQTTADSATLQTRSTELLTNIKTDAQTLINEAKATISSSVSQLTQHITDLKDKTERDIQVLNTALDNSIGQLRTEVTELAKSTGSRLQMFEQSHTATLQQTVDTFTKRTGDRLEEVTVDFRTKATEVEALVRKSASENDAETKRLTSELDKLESRIRDSIERATAYGLFQSFQTRQESLAKSKTRWAYALGCAVAASLCASWWFIHSLQYVHEYNAAFYLKLSISLPIIYAIAFCSLQYSRERRLEEEYAFKSNVSISLEPYQRLVRQLVDENKPEELAKYTAFVIESVNRVFTSPTESIFDDHAKKDGISIEKLTRIVKDLLEPLLSVATKK